MPVFVLAEIRRDILADECGSTLLASRCILRLADSECKEHPSPIASLPSGLPTSWGTAHVLRKTNAARFSWLKFFKRSPEKRFGATKAESSNLLAMRSWRNFQAPRSRWKRERS